MYMLSWYTVLSVHCGVKFAICQFPSAICAFRSLYKLIFIRIFKDWSRTKQIPYSVSIIVSYTSLEIQCFAQLILLWHNPLPLCALELHRTTFISFLPVTLPYLTTSMLWFFLLCSKLQSLCLFSNLFWSINGNRHDALCKFQVFILVFFSALTTVTFETSI